MAHAPSLGALALAAALGAAAPAHAQDCVPDCRTGYACYDGVCLERCNPPCPAGTECTDAATCVAPALPAPARASAAPAAPAAAPPITPAEPERRGAVFAATVDVLGLLQFGPTLRLELGVDNVSVSLQARAMNAGLLSYFMDDIGGYAGTAEFQWGIGGALLVRYYFQPGLVGGFLGGGAEYNAFELRDTTGATQYVAADHNVIVGIEGGYRWGFGSFVLGLGGVVGLAIPVVSSITFLPTSTARDARNDATFSPFLLAMVEIGFRS